MTKVPASFWNALEANYRTRISRRGVFQEEDRQWLQEQPRKEMLERGWISGETELEQFLTGQAWADSPDEKIADDYAAEMLLPHANNDEVRALQTSADLDAFACEHDLTPCIVAGRYHHLMRRLDKFNAVANHFAWAEGEWKVA